MFPRRITTRQFQLRDILAPFSLAKHPRVLIPACAHAITFCYANIALIVEMPIAFGEKFNFDAQQIGLQFIAIIIGCVLGEQVSGPMSDWFLKSVRRRKGHSCPADRLWLSYIAFATVFAGLLSWGFQLQHATTWDVTPCVGAAIASFGNQMQTTILTTFAVESKPERAAEVGVFINVFRQMYGFVSLQIFDLQLLKSTKPIRNLAWPLLLPRHVLCVRLRRGCGCNGCYYSWLLTVSNNRRAICSYSK